MILICLALFTFTFANGCNIEEADNCAKNVMIFGNRDVPTPTSIPEVDALCKTELDAIACLKGFAGTCLKDAIQREIANMILTKGENHLKGRCNDNKQKEIFLKNVACFNPRSKAEPIDECTDKGIIMFEKLKDIPKEKRIGGICCTLHFIRECAAQKVATICGQETVEYFEGILEEVTDEALDMSCPKLKSVAECDANYDATAWKTLKDQAASDDPAVLAKRHKYKSGLAPLLELL